MDDLVTTDWLARNLGADDLAIVDCSFFMPADGRDAGGGVRRRAYPRRALPRYRRGRRPRPSRAAHAAVAPPISARRWSRSGSGATTASSSMTTARCAPPRAAGSCCAISAPNGSRSSMAGFQKWQREGRPVESGPASRAHGRASMRSQRPMRWSTRPRSPRQRELPVVDARGKSRFEGSEADPRPGSPRATSPDRATCPMPRSIATMARFKSDAALARGIRGGGGRSGTAVHRHLRIGRDRQQPDLRRAPARWARRRNSMMAAGRNGAPTRRRPRNWGRQNAKA